MFHAYSFLLEKLIYNAFNRLKPNNRDEIRSANLALISGRQMHRINACIFLVAITKNHLTFFNIQMVSTNHTYTAGQSLLFYNFHNYFRINAIIRASGPMCVPIAMPISCRLQPVSPNCCTVSSINCCPISALSLCANMTGIAGSAS